MFDCSPENRNAGATSSHRHSTVVAGFVGVSIAAMPAATCCAAVLMSCA